MYLSCDFVLYSDHWHPEMLPTLRAEELRGILECTMLQSCVGIGLVNSIQI